MDLLTEARELGELVAWTGNKEMETGCTGTTEMGRIHDALDRLEVIADILGPTAKRLPGLPRVASKPTGPTGNTSAATGPQTRR